MTVFFVSLKKFASSIIILEEREERADYYESETASLVQSQHSGDPEHPTDRRYKPSWFTRMLRRSRRENYQPIGED